MTTPSRISDMELVDIASLKLTPPMKAALVDAFEDGAGGYALWFDTNKHTAYALNNRRLVDDFFHLTKSGIAARKALGGNLK